jgi:hypothetical protein
MAPLDVDAEVLSAFIEDTVGRVLHGRRRFHGSGAGYWPTDGPSGPVTPSRMAVVA